jgi:NAD(P)-dependent dehydrogenase (short-subunit alcohol dehydrogenase family)
MRLKDKVALITGAGQGLGEAIATRLATEGCRVALTDVNAEKAGQAAAKVRYSRRQCGCFACR